MKNSKQKLSTLHLICGLPGSGKTTLSKKLESTVGAIRFSPDEWIKDIWPPEVSETEGNRYRDQIEKLQWKIARQILKAGNDVVIEWGTWSKEERIKLRDEAWKIGSKVKFYHLDAPKEVLIERILKRNKNLGQYEFLMPEDKLESELNKYIKLFQIPQDDELDAYDYLG